MTPMQSLQETETYCHAAQDFLIQKGLHRNRPDIDQLKAILEVFAALPYENLSKIIKYHHAPQGGHSVRFPDEVFEDHLKHGLGGTCFSLAYSLLTLLHFCEFQAYAVLADMRYGRQTHCAVVLLWEDEKYLIDPGYLLTRPLRIVPQGESRMQTAVSVVELLYESAQGAYQLWTTQSGNRKWRYSWVDHPVSMDEFHARWMDSFQWNGMHGLCLNKISQDRMVYLHKNFMRETSINGKRNFKINDHYPQVVARTFAIDVHIVEEAQAAVGKNKVGKWESGLWVAPTCRTRENP